MLHDLEAQGLLAGAKDYVVPLGKCQRCKTIVEPRLSTQWFVAVTKESVSGGLSMAEAARRVVEQGALRFTPENYGAIYLQWVENLHDWCISRQLWWGHRIPAWHCANCRQITVARQAPSSCPHCGSSELEQDPDVLDTWFSSALLPFTTLGWPDAARDLEVFYPNTLLITGFDILFFWVARMVMMGCHFMAPPHRPRSTVDGRRSTAEELDARNLRVDTATLRAELDEGQRAKSVPAADRRPPAADLFESVPFREVYIHALVRDAERQKMSKTKGNVLDPIEVIEEYGTDATRFTLAAQAAPGTDIAFNPSRTEGYRAFANKIWNAARFMFMNVDRAQEAGQWSGASGQSPEISGVAGFLAVTLEDRWILSRINRVAEEMNQAIRAYRFDNACHAIYQFFWGEFCDWYLELIKPRLNSDG